MTTGITHFTSQAAAASILNGWCRDLARGDTSTEGSMEVKVRLYSRWGTNDPGEPHMVEYGADRTMQKHPEGAPAQSRSTFPDDVFMWCGSTPQPGEDGETADRLEMWRAYGDNGHGVALTTWWNIQELEVEGLEIVEVKYVPDRSSVDAKVRQLMNEQLDQTKSRSEREEIRKRRMRIDASHKNLDYKSEQEVRLVCLLGDESGSMLRQNFRFEASSRRLRSYIKRPVRLRTTLTSLDITLGPTMNRSDVNHWKQVGEWTLAQMGISGGRVEQSYLQYLG